MAIQYSIYNAADASRFVSSHWVHTRTADSKELVTMSGIVIIDYKGGGSEWKRDRLELQLRLPPPVTYNPTQNKWFKIEHWAPFVTINAIYNQEHAVNAGWAVDAFGGPGAVSTPGPVTIWADLAIRDIDGYLYRVGYTLTVSGVFVPAPPGPD